MKTKVIRTLLTIACLLCSMQMSAYDFEVDGIYYKIVSDADKTCEVISGDTKYSGDVEIPANVTYDGEIWTVTVIGRDAFEGCSGLTSITIPNSVTGIGRDVFSGCSGLTSITIPNSVTVTEESAFYNCIVLEKLIIEDGDKTIQIDSRSFSNCPLKYLYLGRPLSLGSRFEGMSTLRGVSIGNSVTSIRAYAFSGCSGLTSVTIPNSVTSIGECAFSGCSGLTIITIPNSVTSIGYRAFAGCSGLTSIKISNSVTSIESDTFQDCSGLTSVTIPNTVTSIGSQAFAGCTGLTSVTIGISVENIGISAFVGCSGLTAIYCLSPYPPQTSEGSFYKLYGSTLYVPNEAVDYYRKTSPWSKFSNIQGIELPTFYFDYNDINMTATVTWANSNKSSSELVIPETTTYLGDTYTVVAIGIEAFKGCSRLTEVTIPKRITTIGKNAFRYCTGLTKVNIPDIRAWCNIKFSDNTYSNPLWYAHHLYLNGEEVKDMVIPDGVTSINDYAFNGCTGLTSATIPDGVTSIGYGAFNGCTGLTSVTIPEGVTSIGESAFQGCRRLTSVTIPNSVTYIGFAAFSECSGLNEVYSFNLTPPNSDYYIFDNEKYQNATLHVPNEALEAYKTTAPWSRFSRIEGFELPIFKFDYDDNKMTATITGINKDKLSSELVIPQTITYLGKTYTVIAIGDEAFKGCDGLTSVTIPNSITAMGEYAFYGCNGLTTVNISDLAAWCGIDFSNITSNPLGYAHHLYLNGREATNLIIPDGVTSIGSYAFDGCRGLTSVTIPNSVTYIGDNAFIRCSGLTSVTVPNSVTTIGACAFYNCSGLTSVTIPNSVTTIGSNAFYGCTGLTTVNINDLAAWCNIKFGPISFIEAHHLYLNGTEVTNLIIPNSVTSIGSYAFYGCHGLTSVTIPNSVTSIGDLAFEDCINLTEIYTLNITPPSANMDKYYYDIYQNATLYVPNEALNAYRNAEGWKNFRNIKGFDPTGIIGIGVDGNGRRNVYYDLNGRRLSAPRKGLNIINGKKVIVK